MDLFSALSADLAPLGAALSLVAVITGTALSLTLAGQVVTLLATRR